MILILFASVYITVLCWYWGFILFKILQSITKEQASFETNSMIMCFSGLAFTGVVFGVLSLFLPVGGLIAHACLVLPAVICAAVYKKECFGLMIQYMKTFKNFHFILLVLLIVYTVLIQSMAASPIHHPDTIHYHAQCIKWIQDYKVVPGLANLGYHFGLQSNWFILSALFSFKFTRFSSIIFLNCTIILWLILFSCSKMNKCLKASNLQSSELFAGLMWLLLLVLSFWSYSQVRLTATSASADFSATLYIWLIFFLAVTNERRNLPASKSLLLVFLSLFVITIKLSSLPVIWLALYYYLSNTTTKTTAVLRLATCTLLVLGPAIIRNILTTGYPLFPSAFADFFQVDWKIPKDILSTRLEYIRTYARLDDLSHTSNKTAFKNITEWAPVWWHNRSLADKMILGGFPVLFSGALILFKEIRRNSMKHWMPALLFSLIGLIFWFVQAPDPRFGFGFIIVSEGVLFSFLSTYLLQKIELNKKILTASLLVFAASLAFYLVYRAKYFFNSGNILVPAGVVKLPFKTIECQGLKMNIPVDDAGCGDNELPCVYENCSNFKLRGSKITDGFKPSDSDLK